jgi:hypothetical protein
MALTNAERQKRWRERNAGWVKLREKNRWLKKKASVTVEANPVTKAVSSRNVKRDILPHFGDELRYEAEPGVDVGYGEMEPNLKGGRQHSPARATSGGTHRSGDGPKPVGACPGGSELTSGLTDLGPAPLGDAPGASLTANEVRTYARLEEFKVRRAQRDKGVEVELIL